MKRLKDILREIEEAARSPERAEKLLNYIDKRWGKDGKIRTSKEEPDKEVPKHIDKVLKPKGPYNTLVNKLKDNYPSPKTKELDTADARPSQKYVYTDIVRNKIRNDDESKEGPIKVASHDGNETVIDGHHRLMAKRLLGKPTFDASYYKLPKGQKK